MSFYVAYTWLITGIIYPFVATAGSMINGEEENDAALGVIIYFTIGAYVLIPWFIACGLVSKFLIVITATIRTDSFVKFIIWLFMTAVVALSIGILIGLIIGAPVNMLLWHISYGVLSVWITSIIRYRYFLKLVKQNAD
jgi:Na+/citrate or Na+/malate symporter